MAFLTYKKSRHGSAVHYERLRSLKLGGRDGLIARHVKTLGSEETRTWKLEIATLLELAGEPTSGIVVLFDVAGRDGTSVCLYELLKIRGSCRDTSTQLALEFSVVVDRELGEDPAAFVRSFTLPLPERPPLLAEVLALTGGPEGGDWRWGAPPMQLGATVVHAQSGHHSAGEPCGNCTCGQREKTK